MTIQTHRTEKISVTYMQRALDMKYLVQLCLNTDLKLLVTT